MWAGRTDHKNAAACVRPLAGLVTVFAIVAALPAATQAADEPAAEFLVLAGDPDAPPLQLPSPAARLESFDQVSDALAADRKRVAALEARLQELEKGVEKPEAKKPEAKKPKEPYEIGSDKALKDTWKDGFQAESANKDFRVKIGGRTQVDAVAFTGGPGPTQPPNKGGLDPSLANTVNFRRGRLRIEGRMYELYDFACEYDYINELNVNNEVFPTERDSGPITAVTDLWLQLREIPILGTVRIEVTLCKSYCLSSLTCTWWSNQD